MRAGLSLMVVVAALGALPLALAAGGKTIATAPLIASRQQYVGDTALMPERGTCFLGNSTFSEYWRVRLTAGDSLTVNFGHTQTDVDFTVSLYPHGTTDSSVAGARALVSQTVGRTGKGRLTFRAARTGTHPLRFASCGGFQTGPFEFTAVVKHGVRMSLAPGGSIARRGTVSVRVRTPDGRPITDRALTVTLRGTWGGRTRVLGRTSPSRGNATFRLNIPASVGSVKLRAAAQGRDYFAAVTATRTVRVR